MEKRSMLGIRLTNPMIKQIKIFCAKNSISVREFVETAIIESFERRGRYVFKSVKQ